MECRVIEGESEKVGAFIAQAVSDLCHFPDPPKVKILDFGCGQGELVRRLLERNYNAYGCDRDAYWSGELEVDEQRLEVIDAEPYRLPFSDDSFDVVVSTSVFEHAQNKEECFREIHRVLRPGGYSIHLLPSKWYLPREPHIFVPLANYFWPKCPRWWLALWARLGVRNSFQHEMTWREVLESNARYCESGISYWSNRRYRDLSLRIFGDYSSPMRFYIDHAYGGFAKLARKLPFRSLSGWLSGQFRMILIVQRKAGDHS